MAILDVYEQATHTRRFALSAIDALARVLGSRGPLPPPIGDVTCAIVEQLAPVPATFDPPLVLWTIRNATGFLILDGTYGREGSRAARVPLSAGTYKARIRSAYYQDFAFDLDWPPAGSSARVPIDKALLPGPAYPFPAIARAAFPEPNTSASLRPYSRGFTLIRGSVFESNGNPVTGAKAELLNFVFDPFPPIPNPPPPAWTFLSCVTGASGDWAILLPDRLRFKNVAPTTTAAVSHAVTVRVTYPDNTVVDVPTTVPLGTEFSLRQTALRGSVIEAGGRPLAGAQITTSAGPETSASRADGQWSLYFALNQPDVPSVTVTVTTPDGASLSSSAAVVHGKTVVVPTFAFA